MTIVPTDVHRTGFDTLVVDDDPVMRRVLLTTLTSDGRNITAASDGDAAWIHVQREQPRLIITDWEMPGLSGPELIQRVRQADGQYTYIILLTARSGLDDLLEGLGAGADDYVKKPFSARELRARVAVGERMLELHDRLEHLSTTDELTGLLNRRAVDGRARAELERSSRSINPCSIGLIDVDRFKVVNDSLGHQAGDLLLSSIAETISRHTRSYDWVGRWGGDEFLVIMPGASADLASNIADRICEHVRQIAVLGADQISVSMGIATAELGESRQLEELMVEADAALYRVKRAGGDGMAGSSAHDPAA